VSLSLLRRVGLWARLAVGLAAAAMVMSILFSESRGAGLGLLVALAILGAGALPKGIWNWRRRRLRRAIYIVVTVVMVSLILAIFVPTVRSAAGDLWRGANALGDVFQDRSARRHLDMWLVGINIAADHPLLGAGQDTYPLLFPEYADQVLPPDRARAYAPYRVESPHNVYLAIAVGAGLPALAAYLAFVAAVILSIVRVARRTEDRHARLVLFGVVAALSGHLVTDLFMTADLTGSWLFWLLMGVGLGFARLVSRHGAAGSSRPTAGSMVAGGSPGTPRAGV
jgi:O-antigen ligase